MKAETKKPVRDPKKNFSKNLWFLRKRRGLTQGQLAKVLGSTRSKIGSYEESRARPQLDMLVTIADYFGVTLDDLLKLELRKVLSWQEEILVHEGSNRTGIV